MFCDRAIRVVAVAFCLCAVPDAQSDSGTIVGHVQLRTRVGTALPSTAYPARAIGVAQSKPLPEIKNVVVYLKDVSYRGALAPRKAEMNQDHETFVPHVLAVTRGSTVDFPNDDPIYHNVFPLSSASSFNLGRDPAGQSRREAMAKAGISRSTARFTRT